MDIIDRIFSELGDFEFVKWLIKKNWPKKKIKATEEEIKQYNIK